MPVSICDGSGRGHARADRPFAFLVSTTPGASDPRLHLGTADYAHALAYHAFRPLLERRGVCTLVDCPESRLAFATRRAEARGERPIHLAFRPPSSAFFTPEVPTVLLSSWAFPEVPDRDLGLDTRSNWARLGRHADLVVGHTRLAAAAFQNAALPCPVECIPVPIAPAHFDVPEYDPAFTLTLHCRHLSWGGPPEPPPAPEPIPPDPEPLPEAARPRPTWKGRCKAALRQGYWQTVGRLTNDRINEALRRRLLGIQPDFVGPPPPPAGPLSLRGLIYTTILNLGDPRKNVEDILTAFLVAFRDRPDATLVIKIATNPFLEGAEATRLGAFYHGLGIRHACRVVLITEYLPDETLRDLMRVTRYYVNASRAEGTCLPLTRALAAGRPALAPDHTAMADYMDDAIGFVVRSHPEPVCWPQDPEGRLTTTWHRLVWSDLRDRFLESARVFDTDRDRYHGRADAARRRMADYAGEASVLAALDRMLDRLPDQALGAHRAANAATRAA